MLCGGGAPRPHRRTQCRVGEFSRSSCETPPTVIGCNPQAVVTQGRASTMTPIRITFPGSSGHELSARLDQPAGVVRGYALFAHCFTCSKDTIATRSIAGRLASLGFGVLRFDFTDLGSSEGDFASTDFTSNVEDLVRAADYMREHFAAPAVLIGHS